MKNFAATKDIYKLQWNIKFWFKYDFISKKYTISAFGQCKNILLVLTNIQLFYPCYFVLVSTKYVCIEIGSNTHFNPYFEVLKLNMLHITYAYSNMDTILRD
jgi:hypothetical protein